MTAMFFFVVVAILAQSRSGLYTTFFNQSEVLTHTGRNSRGFAIWEYYARTNMHGNVFS